MRYPFRCTACGLEFEVSRPMSEAGRDAVCPTDDARAERIFTAPQTHFNHPPASATAKATRAPTPRGYAHSGHSHGPGTAPHTH